MKNVLRVLIVAAFVTAFALPALAQDAAATPAAQAGPCTTEVEAKAALYKKFLDNYKGTPDQQKVASDTGKEYLSKYGTCTDEGDVKIATFVRNWVTRYDVAVRDFACTDAFNKKDYARAFQACNVILKEQPDNVDIVLMLARGGYANVTATTPSTALNAEAARMARRAIELIQSGKTPAKWDPFPNQDEALGFLYYAQGVFTRETDPAAASAAFIKAAQSNSIFKKESSTYTYLADIYEKTELKKLVDEYNVAFPPNVPIPDEKKPQYNEMMGRINRVLDRLIDSYARAASILNSDPKADPKNKTAVMNTLTRYYKQRHEDKEDGLQQLIASVMNTPLMLPGQEPAPAATTTSSQVTPADGATKPAATTTTTPANGAKPVATPPATTTPANGTKPAPKPQSKTNKPAAKPAVTTSGR